MTTDASVAYGQPDGQYRAEPGENQSHLKHIIKSPQHYLVSKKRKFSPSLSMEIGSAVHCRVLEGDEQFNDRYVLKPDDISFTTKAGKEWKASIGNKTILSTSDQYQSWLAVEGMTNSLRSLEWFQENRFEDYTKFNEVSLYWTKDKIKCKARLDRIIDDGDVIKILDIKSTDDCSEKQFSRKVFGDFNYLFQAAWYCEAAEAYYKKPAIFVFVVIERVPPYSIGIYEVSDLAMEEGITQINQARSILAECLEKKTWPGPEVQYSVIDLPIWHQPSTPLLSPEVIDLLDGFSSSPLF